MSREARWKFMELWWGEFTVPGLRHNCTVAQARSSHSHFPGNLARERAEMADLSTQLTQTAI
jgi:hypothetical protein